MTASLPAGRPVVPVIFYRALLLAADTAPIDALCEALAARGLAPAPLVDHEPQGAGRRGLRARSAARGSTRRRSSPPRRSPPAATRRADAARRPDVPVLQVVIATTRRAAWRDSPRGLGAADLAMHVVLPELDGRVLAGAIAFKDPLPAHGASSPSRRSPTGRSPTASPWSRSASPRWCASHATARRERRVAVLMPDYPGAPGRAGYAVGLDVPASVVALLADLAAAGYRVDDAPDTLARAARCADAGAKRAPAA